MNNNIEDLDPQFKVKVKLFLEDAKKQGHNIKIFEGLRTKKRQQELYAQGRTKPGKIVTWTLQSNHLSGKAVDIVFIVNGQPSWSGDYDSIIKIASKYGINNLKPKETCHFEDNGIPYKTKPMNRYKDQMLKLLKEKNSKPIFADHDSTDSLNEGEIKCLIEIYGLRKGE